MNVSFTQAIMGNQSDLPVPPEFETPEGRMNGAREIWFNDYVNRMFDMSIEPEKYQNNEEEKKTFERMKLVMSYCKIEAHQINPKRNPEFKQELDAYKIRDRHIVYRIGSNLLVKAKNNTIPISVISGFTFFFIKCMQKESGSLLHFHR